LLEKVQTTEVFLSAFP